MKERILECSPNDPYGMAVLQHYRLADGDHGITMELLREIDEELSDYDLEIEIINDTDDIFYRIISTNWRDITIKKYEASLMRNKKQDLIDMIIDNLSEDELGNLYDNNYRDTSDETVEDKNDCQG